MRRRQATPRNWRRGFDWDSAHPIASGGTSGMRGADWLRVPSDNVDPISGLFVAPKTLVKTLLWPHILITGMGSGNHVDFYLGVCAWDGPDGNPPAVANCPAAENGSFDWIFWLPIGVTNTGGVYADWNNNFQNASQTGGVFSDAQRKLPPGTGLLWVISAFPASGNPSFSFSLPARMGLKGDVTAVGLGGS